MPPLAHSARPEKGIPPQLYTTHVSRVLEDACATLVGLRDTRTRSAPYSKRQSDMPPSPRSTISANSIPQTRPCWPRPGPAPKPRTTSMPAWPTCYAIR